MARRASTARLVIAGSVLTLAGFGAAVASILRDQSVVDDFVRLPATCSTTVRVAETTRYTLYYENKGVVGDLGGCSNDDRAYDLAAVDEDGLPFAIAVAIVDDAGAAVAPATISGDPADYRTPDYEGTAIFAVDLEAGRSYTFRVDADNDAAVVSLGRDVNTTSSVLLLTGIGLIVVGLPILLIGLVWTVQARRKRVAIVDWGPPSLADRAPTGDAER